MSSITFRALAEDVLRLRDEQNIRGISRERSRYRVHIQHASFIDKPITDVTSPEIREWLRVMQETLALGPGPTRKLDRATINRAQTLVSAIFAEAIERQIIETNPALVKLKKRVTEADTVEKWSYLSHDEQRAILECDAISEADKLTIRFAIGTGLRQGEQFSLELPDLIIDGDNPRVVVRYSVPHKGKKTPPKNGKRREVPLMGATLDAARQWVEMLPSFAPSNPLGLVFPTERGCHRQQGKPLGRSKSIQHVYQVAGVPRRKGLHWHALRHTFASNLLRQGMGLEFVQVLMGHSSITVTQRYAHLSKDDVRQEMVKTLMPTTALALPTVTPLQRLAFGLAGAASQLAAMFKGPDHAA